MARLLMRALTLAGFEPMLASRLRTHGFEPAEAALAERASSHKDEAQVASEVPPE